ncbi:hypothetical protein M413DRAFT_350905 [Hebeloma cylindrosporum]|uniref:Uncharacterized protein n=1 Tax=Hebeloma cylindrosporum TaxID=76867 RepID=A0A0C2Y2M3_HEBCY|nr:hypothetical protein M413DRAFT_350905 [Hebeloma cylindrosporum h7]
MLGTSTTFWDSPSLNISLYFATRRLWTSCGTNNHFEPAYFFRCQIASTKLMMWPNITCDTSQILLPFLPPNSIFGRRTKIGRTLFTSFFLPPPPRAEGVHLQQPHWTLRLW